MEVARRAYQARSPMAWLGDITEDVEIRFDVCSTVDLRVLARQLSQQQEGRWHLPDEDASTLAGLILFESRTIPSPGQEFRFHDLL